MQTLQWWIPHLGHTEWLAHGVIFAVNLALFAFARPLLNSMGSGRENDSRVRILRGLNVFVMLLQVLDLVLLRITSDYQHYFIRAGLSLMAVYGGLLVYSIGCYFSRKKFGVEKELDQQRIFLETYSSRLVEILLLAVIAFSTIYALIIIWGFDSLLETTGIIGIFVAFLAFTSSIWAPDLISGLIILNTQMLEDGDVVVIDGYPDEYIIHKVTFIYILLYDIRNNHRTLMRNSRFIQSKIDNISRIASTDGIRKKLVYNIGYPDFSGAEDRAVAYKQFRTRIDRMFHRAFENACEDEKIHINRNKPFEWALTSTGNFALEYSLWFYLERIPNTKVTATIRKHLMRTIYRVNEAIYASSVIEDIDLSTPNLEQVSLLSESVSRQLQKPHQLDDTPTPPNGSTQSQ